MIPECGHGYESLLQMRDQRVNVLGFVGQVTQSGIITSPSSWHKQSQTIQKRTYLACAPTKQQAKLESWAVVCPKLALHGGHTYSDSWRGVPLSVNTGILDYRLHKTCQYKTLGTVPG